MARTNVPITTLSQDTMNANPGTTAIDPTNGMVIAANSFTRRLLIEFTNTFAGSKSATIRAGVNPPAVRSGLGDLVQAIAQNGVYIACIESARFAQADGSINLDFTASMTGTVRAIALPQ